MHTASLPNGMKVIIERSTSRALYCGIVAKAGTRHEEPADSGMAHFMEHMAFKGTKQRTARAITGLLERRGGDLSAFTTKQETVYYAQVLPEDFHLAADLLCDIVFQSTYPQTEIDKEVEVICDEIESYRDSPSELIFDDFERLLFPDQPLGRDILGNPQRLRQYTTADALRFASKHYLPNNCVFYVYGNIDEIRAQQIISRALIGKACREQPLDSKSSKQAIEPKAAPSFYQEIHKDTHQAHVVLGAPTFGFMDPRYPAILLINNMLGGPAPNSRLNLSLRERAGLVYSVDSYLTTYPDAGLWTVYFGSDFKDVERCLRLIHKEIHNIANQPLSQRALKAAKRQYIRQTLLSLDNFENYAISLGKYYAHHGQPLNIDRYCQQIEALTAEQILSTAAEVFQTKRISTLIYR